MKIPEMMLQAKDIVVDPEGIVFRVREMTTQGEEGHGVDWTTSLFVLRDLYENDANRIFCISERIRCLKELMKHPRMRGWTIEDPHPAYVITNGAVFHAIAKCPLQMNENRIWFDADEFFRIVLEECEPEGKA